MTQADDPITLLAALRLRAIEMPDAHAILAPGRPPLTFTGLWGHIEYLTRALGCFSLGPHDAVAAVLPDDAETLCAFLGVCATTGFAPIDSNLADVELADCLRDLRPAALLSPAGFASSAAEAARAIGIPVLEVRSSLDRAAGLFTLSGVSAPAAPIMADPEPSNLALLLRTSATTGRAKFVPLTHANLAAMAQASAGALQLSAADRFLNMMPLFHLQGMLSAFEQLMVGGSVVCAPAFDAERFAGWIDEFQPTWYTAGPVLHRSILTLHREAREVSWPQLRFVRSVGSALPAALLRELEETLRVPVVEGYGLTEVGAVTSTPLALHASKPGSAGIRIVPGVEIADESGNLLPALSTGEIIVRGPNVMREYRDDAEATTEAFRNGWFRSGDLGFFDDDGYLHVTGRIKEMINRGGEKILPGEIDKVLMAHPAVADAAAFGFPHPTLGEEVGVAVLLRAGASATESELRQFAAPSLAAFKTPRRVFFVNAMPKGPTGKPQRHKVAEMFRSESDDTRERRPFVPASTPLEKTLAALWTRVLDGTPAGMQDDFFALGGDSFAMTLMLAEVSAEFGTLPDPMDFLMNPTLASLAVLVAACSPNGELTEASYVCALQPRGDRVPFFCVPGTSQDPYYFRNLARRLGREQPLYVLRGPRTAGERSPHTVEQTAGNFVHAMRSVQPQGPYALGGHCYGGIVAFEVARQLSAAGERIALLTLLDTPTPGYPKVLRGWRLYCTEAFRLVRERRVSTRELMSHARMLARRARRWFEGHLGRAAVKARIDFQVVDTAVANEVAGRIYAPGPFPGRVVTFLAGDVQHGTRVLADPRLGWRDFALGGLDVLRVAGGHDTMLAEPHVQDLARQLTALLDPLNSSAAPCH